MPSTTRDGVPLFYEDYGTGTPIVLQHPLSADGRAWSAIGVAEALVAADFRVIVPDALGHGKSGDSSGSRVGLDQRVQDVLAVADILNLNHFHYVGYSMGGWIGTGLARHEPKRLLSLVIAGWDPIDGARHFTPMKTTGDRRAEFGQTIAELAAEKSKRVPPDAVQLLGYVDTYERLFIDLPSIVSLAGHDFPMLLAVGRGDPYSPAVVSSAEALDVDLLELPGDHITAFWSAEFRTGLVDWLTRVPRPVGDR